MSNKIPFNLEAFKAGQKASTRDGSVATFIGICDECENSEKLIVHTVRHKHVYGTLLNGLIHENDLEANGDLVSMVSRHQHLIDSYNPEDTWQVYNLDAWNTLEGEPEWHEGLDYRLHPQNDLIKAWKKGAKIELLVKSDEYSEDRWVSPASFTWNENSTYRIKPEPTYPIYKHSVNGYTVSSLVQHAGDKGQDWTPPTEAPKTKTIYEWIYKDGDGDWRISETLNTDSELTEYKGIKTGRSWEV